MDDRLRVLIKSIVRRNGKNMDKDLKKALKDKLSTAKKLPPGIITDAAKLAQSKYNDDMDITLRRMRHFMTNRLGKKNEIEWQEFVVKNFDAFQHEEITLVQSTQHNFNVTESVVMSDTGSAYPTEDSYRACTASLKKLLRKDLGTTVQTLIMNKLYSALINTSDYILNFSSLVQLMMIVMRNNQFFVKQDNINTRRVNGFKLTTIVPNQFHTDSTPYTIEPLGVDVKNSADFDADFSLLFQEKHLLLIHSKYFGIRGASEQNLIAHPVQNALFKLLETENVKKETFAVQNVPSSLVSLALQIYTTNFKNMWAEKFTINKLLDKVLIVLLRLHLAPERESQRRQKMLKHSKEVKEKHVSKNYGRYILRAEHKKLKRYQKKLSAATMDKEEQEKWSVLVQKAEIRIMKLKEYNFTKF